MAGVLDLVVVVLLRELDVSAVNSALNSVVALVIVALALNAVVLELDGLPDHVELLAFAFVLVVPLPHVPWHV